MILKKVGFHMKSVLPSSRISPTSGLNNLAQISFQSIKSRQTAKRAKIINQFSKAM